MPGYVMSGQVKALKVLTSFRVADFSNHHGHNSVAEKKSG